MKPTLKLLYAVIIWVLMIVISTIIKLKPDPVLYMYIALVISLLSRTNGK